MDNRWQAVRGRCITLTMESTQETMVSRGSKLTTEGRPEGQQTDHVGQGQHTHSRGVGAGS